MVNREATNLLPRILGLYVAGLFAIVAATAFCPFGKLVVWLLIAWVGLYFVFALAVFSAPFVLMAVALCHWGARVLRRLGHAILWSKPELGESPGVWDRWLDGPTSSRSS
jgi:hypothetical protein